MHYEIKVFKNMKYMLNYPNDYCEGNKYPIIIFLHGAGTRGTDTNKLIENPYFKEIKKHKNFPFITIAPLCEEDTWFDVFTLLKELVLEISISEYADREKVYTIGASMGGYAAWQLIMSLPEVFAAAVPICGGGMYWNAARAVNVPVWAFHGENDDAVFFEESKKMTDALNNAGGRAKLTVFPNTGHDAWTAVYSDFRVFEWLLENKNENIKAIHSLYDNTELYG